MSGMDKLEKMVFEKRPIKCSRCGNILIFNGGGSYLCTSCGNIDLDNFGKVKQFLDTNGAAPAIVIEQATGVSAEIIENMLREGRLQIPDPSEYYIKCERCKCNIRYGRFCQNCIRELAGGIKGIFIAEEGQKPKSEVRKLSYEEGKKPKLEGKMRYFTDRRK